MNNDNAMPGALAEAAAEEEAARAAFLKEAEAAAARTKRLEEENARLTREVAERAKVLESTTTHAVENSRRNTDMWKRATDILKGGAVAVLLIAFVVGGVYFLRGENTTAGVSERRIADIATETFKLQIKPVVGDIAKLDKSVADTKNAVGALDGRFSTFQNTMDSIQKLLEQKKDAAPVVTSSVEAKRLAQLKTECLPEASSDVNVKEDLSEQAFQALLTDCKAKKAAAVRQAQQSGTSSSQPQVAARQPDADSDDAQGDEPAASDDEGEGAGAVRTGRYDSRTASAMAPAVTQAGYNGPHFGGRGHGRPHGRPNCRKWGPGFDFVNGQCRQTFARDGRVVQYDRPGTNDCRPGERMPLVVPLPHGGTRTINMVCRPDGQMRR